MADKTLRVIFKAVDQFSDVTKDLEGKSGETGIGGVVSAINGIVGPAVLAAGAISFFEVTIKKGKFLKAKCRPKKMHFRAKTVFTDGTKTVDKDKFKCKQKK